MRILWVIRSVKAPEYNIELYHILGGPPYMVEKAGSQVQQWEPPWYLRYVCFLYLCVCFISFIFRMIIHDINYLCPGTCAINLSLFLFSFSFSVYLGCLFCLLSYCPGTCVILIVILKVILIVIVTVIVIVTIVIVILTYVIL